MNLERVLRHTTNFIRPVTAGGMGLRLVFVQLTCLKALITTRTHRRPGRSWCALYLSVEAVRMGGYSPGWAGIEQPPQCES